MTIHKPGEYMDFVAYCNKRKLCSKEYRNAKIELYNGEINLKEYFKKLRSIQEVALELEIEYFDILHMRL